MMQLPEMEETNIVPIPVLESLLEVIDNKITAKLWFNYFLIESNL